MAKQASLLVRARSALASWRSIVPGTQRLLHALCHRVAPLPVLSAFVTGVVVTLMVQHAVGGRNPAAMGSVISAPAEPRVVPLATPPVIITPIPATTPEPVAKVAHPRPKAAPKPETQAQPVARRAASVKISGRVVKRHGAGGRWNDSEWVDPFAD